jgi:hypothetical protein
MNETTKPGVRIELTMALAERLEDVLSWVDDEGPEGEGWKSNLLSAVELIVSDAIRAAKKAKS